MPRDARAFSSATFLPPLSSPSPFAMARNSNEKTDIPVPEPRHRVGPAGVSSGISFRDLPPPSLDQIKHVCEHYQTKCAGTYESLASRYVYQMATEIELLVDALQESGLGREEGPVWTNSANAAYAGASCTDTRPETKGNRNKRHFSGKHRSRPRTASGTRRPDRKAGKPCPPSCAPDRSEASIVSPPPSVTRHYRVFVPSSPKIESHSRSSLSRRRQRRASRDTLSHLNLEDQNKEVLRWLAEEMQRSGALLKHSKNLHEAELISARKEIDKVKRAAKLLVRAVHRKGRDRAARAESAAAEERRRRRRERERMECRVRSRLMRDDGVGNARDYTNSKYHSWEQLYDDTTEVSFSFSDASDLTSILGELAEET